MEKMRNTDGYCVQFYRNKFENLEAMDNFLVKIQTLK